MENRYKERFPGMEATMDSMWGGEKYYMAIYQVFKDLRLVKTLGSDGKYRYISDASRSSNNLTAFEQLFSGSVVSVACARNIVVIKTLSGMANAVCASLDSTENPSIVGTIAGDDTIFAACSDDRSAAELTDSLKQYIINK